jgi:hypothetical protein
MMTWNATNRLSKHEYELACQGINGELREDRELVAGLLDYGNNKGRE